MKGGKRGTALQMHDVGDCPPPRGKKTIGVLKLKEIGDEKQRPEGINVGEPQC